MNHKPFRTLTWLMWLALPLTALRFWGAWDQLPLRMATHFLASGQPNGWMTREVALIFALGVTAFVLLVFTGVLLVMQKQKTAGAFSWAMLAFSYFVIGFVYVGNEKVLDYTLTGQPMDLHFWLLLTPPALIVLMAVYLYSKRGEELPAAVSLADEVHSSRPFAALIAISGAGMLLTAAPARVGPVRLVAGIIFSIVLLFAISAWSGFHYLFSSHGLEIRTLGFRLRSIPVEQVERYSVQPWSFWRGYGIRGVGNSRAYVWGNNGVRIDTTQGTVFLGHRDPERIIQDLDMITKRVSRG